MSAVLALLAPILAGLWAVDVLARGRALALSERVLRGVTGVALGAGLASAAHAGLLFLGGTPEAARGGTKDAVFCGVALVALLALLARRQRRAGVVPVPSPQGGAPRAAAAAVAVACLATIGVFVLRTIRMPDGEFDAIAIWNLRGRLLLKGGGDASVVFSTLMPGSHPEYPLMLPGLSAAGWLYAGEDAWWVPAAQGLFWLGLLAAALCAALARLAGARAACLGILLLLAAPLVVQVAAQQYADVPLAALLLLAVSWLALARRGPPESAGRSLALSGVCSSLAAWTKNEGLAHTVALALVVAAVPMEGVSRRRAVGHFALGAAPLLLAGIGLRALVAPAGPLVQGGGQDGILAHLFDPGRYAEIAEAFARETTSARHWALTIPALLVYGALPRTTDPSRTRLAVGAALLLVALAYAGVYVLTRRPLTWHLKTSLHRLVLHLYPSLVLWAMVTRRIDSRATEGQHRGLPIEEPCVP